MNVKLAAWICGLALVTVIAYESATSRDPRAAGLRAKVTG